MFLSYAALFQLFWMPALLRAYLLLGTFLSGFAFLLYRHKQDKAKIGIDADGAFLCKRGRVVRLLFVRVNSFQLIAKREQKSKLLGWLWPQFHVVYCDSVSAEKYRMLQSYAAQQILLSRSEEARKSFSKD
ncbi:hypothetical protein ACMUMQ_14365 [Marinomonas sp. 2405UD66-6]|uniref:hypothetical protein n=1 Tax=Marinomonas sp. 2405UD66-6 TaxID=3391834 RepID=UPI0039C945C7